MKEIISAITNKGRVTIPLEVRRVLRLDTHDKVAFVIDDAGNVQLKAPRFSTVASLRGAAGTLSRSLTKDEILEIAHEEVTKAIVSTS